MAPPVPSKRRSTTSSWSGSDPGSPTEKLLSVRPDPPPQPRGPSPQLMGLAQPRLGVAATGYYSSGGGVGGGVGAGSRLSGSAMGSPSSFSPGRPAAAAATATPSPTLSQIVLRTRSPNKASDTDASSVGSTPVTSPPPRLQKPRVPPKPKPSAALMVMSRRSLGPDQVSSSSADDADDDPARLTPLVSASSSPDVVPTTGGRCLDDSPPPSGGDVLPASSLLSDEEGSTDAEEWSLTSGLAAVDSDDSTNCT